MSIPTGPCSREYAARWYDALGQTITMPATDRETAEGIVTQRRHGRASAHLVTRTVTTGSWEPADLLDSHPTPPHRPGGVAHAEWAVTWWDQVTGNQEVTMADSPRDQRDLTYARGIACGIRAAKPGAKTKVVGRHVTATPWEPAAEDTPTTD